MAIWALVGISLFWLGWPWLWYDPSSRLRAYWGTGVARPTILVQYFGQVFADRDVPWHYPWFYFAATVPLGLQLLGGIGVVQGWKNRRADAFPLLLAGTIAAFLDSLQHARADLRRRTTVLARLSGMVALDRSGLRHALEPFSTDSVSVADFGSFWLASCWPRVMERSSLHPFGLSFYNGLTGGLSGAERLGLELTYWNDAVDQVLLDRLAREGQPGATGGARAHSLPTAGSPDDKPGPGAGRHHLAGRAGRRASGVGRPVAANRLLATARSRSGSSRARADASQLGRGKGFGSRHSGTFHRQRHASRASTTFRTAIDAQSNYASTQARSRQQATLSKDLRKLPPSL